MDTPLPSLIADRSSTADLLAPMSSRLRTGNSAATDFAKVLGRWSPDKKVAPERQAREAAEELVAVSFVQPLLKQLRDTNHAAEPFAPSQGEKQFQSLNDAVLSQRIVKASNFPLVDRLAGDLLKKSHQLAQPRTEVHA